MGYNAVAKLSGFVSVGSEVPFLDPNKVLIVGIDIPETEENWYAHCPRINDETDADLEPYVEYILSGGKTDPVDCYRDGDRMVILDGRRTTRAARIARSRQTHAKVPAAERATVRVLLHRGTPDALFRINAESHNQRPLTAMQRAKLILTYFNRVSEDLEKTAAFFRVDEKTVRNSLALFDLSPTAQKAVDNKEISVSAARKLSALPKEDQNATIAEMKKAGATKGAAADAAVGKAKRGEKIETADRRRARPKTFIEAWAKELHKDPDFHNLAEILLFLLGGDLPENLRGNVKIMKTLEKAGWKDKAAPKEKKGKKEAA